MSESDSISMADATVSSASVPSSRRAMFKPRHLTNLQTRRRMALARQKSARMAAQHAARLAHLTTQTEGQEITSETRIDTTQLPAAFSAQASQEAVVQRKVEQSYSSQLQVPEWMIDVPSDLNLNWYVMARPEGKHCVVVSNNGYTVVRERSGKLLLNFQSLLPNGSRSTMQGREDYCVLDCIFNAEQETLYVLDLICWKGYALYDCSADMRLFWAQSRLSELGSLEKSDLSTNQISIVLLPFYECSVAGLQTAYSTPAPYPKDGLLFYNKTSNYICGLTPLVLKWKDKHCSSFAVDTPDGASPFPTQSVVLRLQQDMSLVALGGEKLGSMPADFASQNNLKPNDLLRFLVSGVTLRDLPSSVAANDDEVFHHMNHHLDLELQGMTFATKVNKLRAISDSTSKIAFQFMVRNDMVHIENIANEIKTQIDTRTMDVSVTPPYVP